MTGRRRWGEAPRPAGRPPLDGRTKARIFALHAEHPELGVRAIAAKVTVETGVSVSRETVRKLLRSAEAEAPDRSAQIVDSAAVEPPWPVALSAIRPMTAEDHAAMDREPGWLV